MAANDGSWIQDPFNWTDKKLNARFSSLGGTCDALGNKLSLQSKALLDEHFAIVSEKIRRSAALLTHVYIDNCYIGDKGFKTILEGLAKVNQVSSHTVILTIKFNFLLILFS